MQLEEHYQDEFLRTQCPTTISNTIKIADDHFYVLMSMLATTLPGTWRDINTIYAYNDINGVIVLPAGHQVEKFEPNEWCTSEQSFSLCLRGTRQPK
jgi:hypothetical protein